MNREEIDALWFKAMEQAIEQHEIATRYHFAALVAAAEHFGGANKMDKQELHALELAEERLRHAVLAERQACVEICRDVARDRALVGDRDGASAASECAETIRGDA